MCFRSGFKSTRTRVQKLETGGQGGGVEKGVGWKRQAGKQSYENSWEWEGIYQGDKGTGKKAGIC